jgi:hypothetical protein
MEGEEYVTAHLMGEPKETELERHHSKKQRKHQTFVSSAKKELSTVRFHTH